MKMKTSSSFATAKASKASQKPAPEPPPHRSVMVRSLRRRLWKALQEEDVDTARRAYTSTKTDYEQWIDEEIYEENRLQEEKNLQRQKDRRPKRSMSLRKLGLTKMPSSRWASSRTLGVTDTRKSVMLEATYGSEVAILQTEFHPNAAFERDDFYSPQDPYDIELLSPPPPPPPPKVKKTKPKRRGPRLAGFSMPWSRNYTYGIDFLGEANAASNSQDSKDDGEKVDETMTTLMHEATRIACPDFVRLLLTQGGGNPNVRNGQMRTALHMVGGGLLRQESRYSESPEKLDVGIRSPVIDLNDENGDDNEDSRSKKAARAVGRLFQKLKDGSTDTAEQPDVLSTTQSDDDFGQLTSKRMDTLLAILSWVHHDDGTPSSGEGPSINSVDARGRTALHYAAELGRSDLCLTILTSFGAILTIVDESGQTPGELAAAENHPELAAQLEARALLYIDPYGLDEELMASVWGGTSDDGESDGKKKKKRKKSAHSQLKPPFCWFETWKMDKVRIERQVRVEKLTTQIQEALTAKQEVRDATEFMYNHGIDDSEEERTLNSDQAVTPKRTAKKHVNNTSENAIRVEVEVPETLFEEAESKPPFRLPKTETNNEETEKTDDDKSGKSEQEDSEKPPIQLVTVELPEEDAELTPKKENDKSEKEDVVEAKKPLEIVVEPPESEGVAAVKSLSEFQILSKKLHPADVNRYAAAFSWNLADAMTAFQENPFEALKHAGVEIDLKEDPKQNDESEEPDATRLCLICCDEASSEDWVDLSGCEHAFCRECLGDYVSENSRAKETGIAMNCPHHECRVPLSLEEVEKLAPSKEVYETLLQTSDENFVANAEDLTFCPHPGCTGVVRRIMPSFANSAKLDRSLLNLAGAVCTACGDEETGDDDGCPLTYEGVRDSNYMMTRNSIQPKRAHRFCFACGSDHMHWPVQCETLDAWKEKITEEIGELEEIEEGEGDNKHFNDVAQRLWMKANTRPCPKCKVAIEKNDGCNHMTCSNRSCRHEFCWICREDWKLHNTETGGFFRCNRWQGDDTHKYYDTPPPPEQRVPDNNNNTITSEALSSEVNYGTSLHSSRVAWKRSKEMGLFLHHYRRWTAHSESATLERAMADTACSRLAAVVEAAIDLNGTAEFDFGGKGLSFVHAAFTELLECRSLLQYSYVFAYFRYPIQYHIRRNRLTKTKEREKSAFEQLQSELEMMTEQMSDIVARKHLRATQVQIMFLTTGAYQRRSELTSFMLSLLNEQLKENKEEEERAKREKNRSTVDRTPNDIGSIFDFPPRDFSARPYHHHHQQHHYNPRYPHQHQVSSRLRRLMDTQYNRRTPFYDSDDDDDLPHMRPLAGRTRLAHSDEDVNHDALRASVQAFFQMGSDDIRNDNDMPPGRFQDWACTECTYMNAGGRRCAMCGTARR